MIKNVLFTLSLLFFVSLPVRLDLSGIWQSYNDPDHVNEVAVAIYMLYESIVHIIT